jgi:hypothetical protein
MAGRAISWESIPMKSANSIRLVLTLALAAAALGWLPEQKGKRKLRMAAIDQPVAAQQA